MRSNDEQQFQDRFAIGKLFLYPPQRLRNTKPCDDGLSLLKHRNFFYGIRYRLRAENNAVR